MTSDDFEVTRRRTLAEGTFLHFEELTLVSASGAETRRDVIRHPGGVAVLPVEGDRLWLIRQHRAPFDEPMDEIPAGKLDARDDDPEEAARRELAEELGATAQRWTHLATMAPSPGYTDEVLEIYAAEGLEFGDRAPDGLEEEESTVRSVSFEEAIDRIDAGTLTDAKTLVAVLQWNRRRT